MRQVVVFIMQVLSFGDEKNKAIVLDDFHAHPETLVQFAAQSEFAPWPMLAERKGYPGVRTSAPEALGLEVLDRLAPVLRSEFGIGSVETLKLQQETLNLMTVPEPELGPLQRAPHFDTSAPNLFAILLYLCDDSHGGTGFYRHRSTGYESITPDRVEHYLDRCFIEFNKYRRPMKYCNESDDLFTKVGFVPAKYNRLVIYRGCVLHSANILGDHSISASATRGRLTANIFVSHE